VENRACAILPERIIRRLLSRATTGSIQGFFDNRIFRGLGCQARGPGTIFIPRALREIGLVSSNPNRAAAMATRPGKIGFVFHILVSAFPIALHDGGAGNLASFPRIKSSHIGGANVSAPNPGSQF
jgi:hypothetical protein